MALLLSVEEVRDRLTFDAGLVDLDLAIESALRGATAALESDLDTEFFPYGAKVDLFRVLHTNIVRTGSADVSSASQRLLLDPVRGLRRDFPMVFVSLKLTHGFVSQTAVLNAYAATLPSNLTDATLREDLRDSAAGIDHVTVESHERGLLTVDAASLAGVYVRVEYTAGFDEQSDELLLGVPRWLKELAYLKTVVLLSNNPVVRSQEENPTPTDAIDEQIRTIINRHSRYEPLAVKSMS